MIAATGLSVLDKNTRRCVGRIFASRWSRTPESACIVVELDGIEPTTSGLQSPRSPS